MNIVCSDGKGWVVIPFTFYLLPHKKGFKMIGALWTGISGLSSHQKAIDNESHNIANVNTIGYKASRISFADQMYQDKIGKGSKILDAEKLYTQGNLKVTGVSFDMALSGQGFFTVSDTRSSGASETFYTRAGNFRMGEDGTLQDAAGNKVQGWAMSPIDQDVDVVSSNPNISVFTSEYNKLLASKIIKYNTSVQTITAKATDYTTTAKADSAVVFSGYGLKTKSTKIADVEALIKDYSTWLQKLKDTPDGASATSIAQVSYVDLPDKHAVTPGTNGEISGDGDQVYVYINGNKYSQSWDTDYATTMRKFADKISAIPGFKAYTAGSGAAPMTSSDYLKSTATTDIALGNLRIEAMIPGQQFTISEVGMISGGVTTQGQAGTLVESITGSGLGALQTSMDALQKAIVGKQQDVYTTADLGVLDGTAAFTYQITIYDKDLGRNVTVPTAALTIAAGDAESVDELVTAINNNTGSGAFLANYVEAFNINGALVIRTKDTNADVEFTGSLDKTASSAADTGDIKKNADYSGREGAGAEFIQIINNIDQTSSKGSLQLRLDTLNISDSAFGEFSVDSTGLITMKQDGAEFAIGQAAIALFNNERGLVPTGDNLLKKSAESGEPIYNINNDKTAKIEGRTLELSTADLSESLVNLMVFQRAFEANAKSITTSDELLNTLINLKR
ncbi:MAG: flagellar hook-basal body complex protein [Arcobacteraceae bacterium]